MANFSQTLYPTRVKLNVNDYQQLPGVSCKLYGNRIYYTS